MKKILLIFLVICCQNVFAGSYKVIGNPETDTVHFASTAKLEFIEGKNHDISGLFLFDPVDSELKISGTLQVDLTTLKTGIDTRDEHMRENHLDTDEYPFAFFQLEKVLDRPSTITVGKNYDVQGMGFFYIRGVKREIAPEISFILIDDSTISVNSRFSIDLEDYKIPRPKALFYKLAETINIRVVFQAELTDDSASITLPEFELLN